MTERSYTVAEIDGLRAACQTRYLYGSTCSKNSTGRVFMQSDLDKAVEEMVRTYMLAGITAEQIYEEDRAKQKTSQNAG